MIIQVHLQGLTFTWTLKTMIFKRYLFLQGGPHFAGVIHNTLSPKVELELLIFT